jgi:hypothetical protein
MRPDRPARRPGAVVALVLLELALMGFAVTAASMGQPAVALVTAVAIANLAGRLARHLIPHRSLPEIGSRTGP